MKTTGGCSGCLPSPLADSFSTRPREADSHAPPGIAEFPDRSGAIFRAGRYAMAPLIASRKGTAQKGPLESLSPQSFFRNSLRFFFPPPLVDVRRSLPLS